jgi:hypothetical protein
MMELLLGPNDGNLRGLRAKARNTRMSAPYPEVTLFSRDRYNFEPFTRLGMNLIADPTFSISSCLSPREIACANLARIDQYFCFTDRRLRKHL